MENETKREGPVYSETAYDDAFRTMESECDDIVIPFVNHMFGENYDKTAVIKRLRNEHFVEKEDGSNDKRITDSNFEIEFGNMVKKYHLECESSKYDGTILIRMFEYNTQIALDEAQKSTDTIRLRFPHTGLLLLRESPNAPHRARVEMELPGGQIPSYEVPIIRMSDYTIDDIFEKKLYMLIPFYMFNYESRLDEINRSEEETGTFIKMYDGIFGRLKAEHDAGNLSDLSYSVIIRMTHSVAYKLTMKREIVQEKVGVFMGGKVLDLPEIRIYHQGKAEGKAEGIAEEQVNTERERKRADVAEERAEKAEERADAAEADNDLLRKEIERLRALQKQKGHDATEQ